MKPRSYVAPRVAVAPAGGTEAERLVGLWRRVLERRLRSRMGSPVWVEIHDNTHTMVTFQRVADGWKLRLHHMFLAAPEDILHALVRFVRDGDAVASFQLDRHIERNRVLIRKVPPSKLRQRQRIQPVGRHHDLAEIYEELNQAYFDGSVDVAITYGPAPRSRLPRKSIKMGSYSAESRLIRIHPALDQAEVPRYFVEWIVFHEMLHHVYKPRRGEDGRRCVHPIELIDHERTFPHYERARRWEEENIDFLLRSRVG